MNDIKPLVSIIIPVYNRAKIINETVFCAINQTYKNIEIIIVDNCSTDNTWEILHDLAKEDNRIKIFSNKVNLGPVLNWAECIKRASGEYYKILWSDDKVSANFIEEAIKLMNNDTAFVISPVEIFNDETGETISRIDYEEKEKYSTEEFLFNQIVHNKIKFMVSPGCALFRGIDIKESFVVDIPNTDNLDFKKFGAGNDLLIFLISAVKYSNVRIAKNTLSLFRSHNDSISIERKDEINLYYEWSKSFFIKNYYPKLVNPYKSKLFLKKIFNQKLVNLYKNSAGHVTLLNLFKAAYRKLQNEE